MRLFSHTSILLAPSLLGIQADHPHSPALQIQPDLSIPSLTSQDWASVVNAPLGPVDAQVQLDAEPSEPAIVVSIEDRLPHSRPLPVVGALRGFVTSILNLALAPLSPFPHLPRGSHHHDSPIDLSHYTIGEIFNWILNHPEKSHEHAHHSLPLHRLAWLVNQSEPVQKLLSDPNADLTLFAPDDEALTPPHKRRHHGHGPISFPLFGRPGKLGPRGFDELPMEQPDVHVFWQALAAGCPHSHSGIEDEGEDKEKKKKILLHLLQVVLTYHVSPGKKPLTEIVDRSTLASALHIESDSSSPAFRIRVGGPPHFTKPGVTALNFFTELGGPGPQSILAKNGVIHLAHGSPLLPPLTPLSQLFLFPKPFSTLTSALQQTKLDDILLPSLVNKTLEFKDEDLDLVDDQVQNILDSLVLESKHKFERRSFTIFAPTNRAFRALGPHLTAFLFSPFGSRILRYVLSYHIVPDIIWYTDHVDETAVSTVKPTGHESGNDFVESYLGQDDGPTLFGASGFPDLPPGHPHVPFHPPMLPWGKANVTNIDLPTLLGSTKNASLSISLVEYHLPGKGLKRQVLVKQPPGPSKSGEPHGKPHKPVPVIVSDAVAWGGAIHVVPSLIHPPVPKDHPAHDAIQRLFSGSFDEHSKKSLFI